MPDQEKKETPQDVKVFDPKLDPGEQAQRTFDALYGAAAKQANLEPDPAKEAAKRATMLELIRNPAAREAGVRSQFARENVGIVRTLARAAIDVFAPPGEALANQLALRQSLTENGTLTPSGVTRLDLMLGAFGANAIGGFAGFFEPIPIVGPKLITPYFGEPARQADQGVSEMLFQYVMEHDPTGELKGVQAMVAGSRILGTLSGTLIPWIGYFRMANIALAKSALGVTSLVADMAAGMAYGAVTGHGSLIAPLLLGKDPHLPQTHADAAPKSFWDQLPRNVATSVLMGAELAGLAAVGRSLIGVFLTSRMRATFMTSQKVSASMDELIAATNATTTAEGLIQVGKVSDEAVAKAIAGDETIVDLIMANPRARSIVQDGGGNVEAMFGAIDDMVGGNISAVYDVANPSQLLRTAQETVRNQTRLLDAARRGLTIGDRLRPGIAHDSKTLRALAEADPNAPMFMGYNTANLPPKAGAFSHTDALETLTTKAGLHETLFRPSKPGAVLRAKTWDDVLEGGTVDEALTRLKGRGIELVVVAEGKGAGQTLVPIVDDVIVSTKRLGIKEFEQLQVQALQRGGQPTKGVTGEILGSQMFPDLVPPEVAIAERFPEHKILTRAARSGVKGNKDFLIYPKDVRMSQARIKQWRKEGFFEGQAVKYKGGTYEYVSALRGGKMRLRLNQSDDSIDVLGTEVQSYYQGVGLPEQIEEGFIPVLAADFKRSMEADMARAADEGIHNAGLREIAQTLDQPGMAKVDRDLAVDVVLHPEDVIGGTQQVLASEQGITKAIKEGKWDDVFLMHPEPISNELDIVFERWLTGAQDRGIVPVSLSPSQGQALKWGLVQKVRKDLFESLDPATKLAWKNVNRELTQAVEALDDNIVTAATLKGFQFTKTSEGFLVRPPMTKQYKMFETEEQAIAYMNETNPVPKELGPGGPLHEFSTLGWTGHNPNLRLVEGDGIPDFLEASADDFIDMYRELGTPVLWSKSMRKLWTDIEDQVAGAIPFATEHFDNLMIGQRQMRNFTAPFIDKANTIWRGISPKRRLQVGAFLRSIDDEAKFLDDGLRNAEADKFGLRPNEKKAVEEMRGVFNELYRVGIERGVFEGMGSDYIWNYFAKIMPQAEQLGHFNESAFAGALPKSAERFFSDRTRDGILSFTETDPWMVHKRYINALGWDLHMQVPWQQTRKLAYTKWKDAPQAWRDAMSKTYGRKGKKLTEAQAGSKLLLPQDVHEAMTSMLTYMRGYPKEVDRAMTKVIGKIGEFMGLDVPKEAVSEMLNSVQATWYGAALGARGAPIVRNWFQNMWNLYPRIGAESINAGRRIGLTPEGFAEAMAGQASTINPRGVIGESRVFSGQLSSAGISGTGPVSSMLAGALNTGLKVGRLNQRLADRLMRGFGSSDLMNRVQAYHAQKHFTGKWLTKLQQGKISEETFISKGLEFWGKSEKAKFMRVLTRDGEEAALRYIGRQGTDLSNYIYGMGAQPLMLQNTAGRFFGMFGTWAVWQKDLMFSNWKNASLGGKTKMAYRYGTMVAALAAIGYRWGFNVGSWMAPMVPLSYVGGPAVQLVVDMRDLMSSPIGYRMRAAGRLAKNIGRLAYPGQLAVESFNRSLQELSDSDPWSAMTAAFFGRPVRRPENPWTSPQWGVDAPIAAPPDAFDSTLAPAPDATHGTLPAPDALRQ